MSIRATRGGGAVTDLSQQGRPSLLARVGAAVQAFRTGPEWFGPGEPMKPVAQEAAQGRAMDYQTGSNMSPTVRQGEAVSHSQMRTLADNYDLMRLIIETRKDQVAKLRWNVRPRDKDAKVDSRCLEAEKLLRRPDREHPWDEWIRALVEEMLVIDAATIYPRKTRGGGLYSLELIDGATIKRVIGTDGRTPLPEDGPAYQQILKGVAAVDYTADELMYRPRNWRVHKFYGFSPVEQVVMTVNIALRRQISQMQYFTEGNIPEALMSVPDNWSVEQIKQFQAHWDDLIEGSTAVRRHAKFVPGGTTYQPTREPTLKDAFDEWLARVVCFAFSVSPTPFVAQVNRATAESAHEAALQEGLAPVMIWIKNVIDSILEDVLGFDDLEFAWSDEQSTNPTEKANVHDVYLRNKVLTPDEVREDLGRDPMTPEQREKAFPAPPAPLALAAPKDGEPPPDDPGSTEKGAYLGDLMKGSAPRPKSDGPAPINRERRAMKRAEKALASVTEAALKEIADEACALLADTTQKADESGFFAMLKAMNYSGFTTFLTDAAPVLGDAAADGAGAALAQLSFDGASLDLVNQHAVAWARKHAAELVGKRILADGSIVDNPSAAWRIDEKTREGLRALVVKAHEDGWSNDTLAKAIQDSYAFSRGRAELIARTETAKADVEGNLIGYRAAGVKKKRWLLAQSDFCSLCAGNAAQGAILIDKPFASGAGGSPGHPKCRCDTLPVMGEQS